MPRLVDVTYEAMSELQREVAAEATTGLRGRMPVPMRAWISSPEMARRAQSLGEFLRYQTSLPPMLSELAILVTARFWTSQYEWHAHAKIAREAGVDLAVIQAIANRETPSFSNPKARVVFDASRMIHEKHSLDNETFERAHELLGEVALAELVGVLGYYTLVSMTLNIFEIGVPEGVPDPLPA